MDREEKQAIIALQVTLSLAVGIAFASSQGGVDAFGIPLFFVCWIGVCDPVGGLRSDVSYFRFLLTWTLQRLWVTFSLAAALVAITSMVRVEFGIFALVGSLVMAAGFWYRSDCGLAKEQV